MYQRFERAVVIGGSMAGMMAARVLADHFESVTIIERDERTRQPEFRRGVPQGRHAHALLVRGQRTIAHLFPRLRESLLDAGAQQVNLGRDMRWHHAGVWKSHFEGDLDALSASRPLIEWTMGEHLRVLPNVEPLDGWSVDDLVHDGTRIIGVMTRARGSKRESQFLPADLVIDASGRGSQTPARLRSFGYLAPEESSVRVDVGYASRIYRQPARARDWRMLYVISQPPEKRGALIVPLEDDRWMVTQVGMHGDHPPEDEAGFMAFAASLPVPDVHEALKYAEPLTKIVQHGFQRTLRRRYEDLHQFPEGLLVLGDAFCSFNPVYGQGMSVASLHANALAECLGARVRSGRDLRGLWKSFFALASRAVDAPWKLSTAEDFRFAETVGERSLTLRLLHRYTHKVQVACGSDPQVTKRFEEVVNMVRSPASLFTPAMVARVVLAGARNRKRAVRHDAPTLPRVISQT